jgi:hypothetical protein
MQIYFLAWKEAISRSGKVQECSTEGLKVQVGPWSTSLCIFLLLGVLSLTTNVRCGLSLFTNQFAPKSNFLYPQTEFSDVSDA